MFCFRLALFNLEDEISILQSVIDFSLVMSCDKMPVKEALALEDRESGKRKRVTQEKQGLSNENNRKCQIAYFRSWF